jgi:hypothetical protein
MRFLILTLIISFISISNLKLLASSDEELSKISTTVDQTDAEETPELNLGSIQSDDEETPELTLLSIQSDDEEAPELTLLSIQSKDEKGPKYILQRGKSCVVERVGDKVINTFKLGRSSCFLDKKRGFLPVKKLPDHEGIREITDIETRGGVVYSVTSPYCYGFDLKDLAIKRDPRLKEIAFLRDLLIKVSEALEHMHTSDIYHRDIKPENIIVDEKGNIKLIDFETAIKKKSKNARPRSTTIGSATERYASPEICLEKYKNPEAKYSSRSYDLIGQDLWQLGSTFCDLMTNEDPKDIFTEDMSKDDKVKLILEKTTKRESGLGLGYTLEIKCFIESFVVFLSHNPEQRGSLAEVLSKLKAQKMLMQWAARCSW